jgi:hypothetical protein
MLLFLTTRGHSEPLRSFVERTFGADTPDCRVKTYDELFLTGRTLQAVHFFTDIERLYDWELLLAADLYRAIRKAGLPCLNDPSRVMARYQLLRRLHATKVNPFNAYRAEDDPRPSRFPVFIRSEATHQAPLSDLLPDQATLDAALQRMREHGIPLRGLIIVEFAAQPIAPGAWRKFGTFKVGDAVLLDHAVVEDRWAVKYGKSGFSTDQMFEDERAAVMANAFAEELRPVFDLAGIEWGRADHATFEGRQIVYEINTNPTIGSQTVQRSPIRDETLRFARERMARQLWRLDFGSGSIVSFEPGRRLRDHRDRNPGVNRSTIRP